MADLKEVIIKKIVDSDKPFLKKWQHNSVMAFLKNNNKKNNVSATLNLIVNRYKAHNIQVRELMNYAIKLEKQNDELKRKNEELQIKLKAIDNSKIPYKKELASIIGLSMRTYNVFKSLNITYVEDLKNITEHDILNCHRKKTWKLNQRDYQRSKTLAEVKNLAEYYGIKLKK